MVKKIYSQPACVVVALGTMHMMAESLHVGGENPITDPNDILTKEYKDVNLWDKEW